MSALTGGASLSDTEDISSLPGQGDAFQATGPNSHGDDGRTKSGDRSGIAVTAWDAESEANGSHAEQQQVKWSAQYVQEVRHHTETLEIEHPVQMSEDCTEIYISLTYREDNKLSKDIVGQDPYTDYIVFVRVSLDDMNFKLPFPKFPLQPKEEMYSFMPGPILEETMSRVLFAHMNTGTRIFSLETGERNYNIWGRH